jgi:hypothetical protein
MSVGIGRVDGLIDERAAVRESAWALSDAIGLSFEWSLSEISGHSQPDPDLRRRV